ncbi:hypothetical protein N7468_003951 [Penicillium chermesinum]|uniref:AAA+ ATPase domain-containing protein n=1 Tax=Penicillium chermesinum TaxID=63820 RepID=A0A9W9TSA5_9EURO|nr:uncharacterized protein N7468_003951 [Penicillium chermesinum]KAJ5239332.1 hypothetical protein N7468_003951 [Penicillium chermesinum]
MDELKKSLVKLVRDKYASARPAAATEPDQSFSGSNVPEKESQVVDKTDLKSPIHTTLGDFESFRSWASTPKFKKILETWDKEASRYTIAEPVATSSDSDDYAEYAFVVRERVERNSEEIRAYIDVKSESLRDILRVVLHGINAISLMEDKPSIEQNHLFHFLPELEKYAHNINNRTECKFSYPQLCLLIDHIKQTYTSVSQRLNSMLPHGHITYDLLWALFKPGCPVYTTCLGTKEPRCVIFDAGEERTHEDETWFNLECWFLDYNGVRFGVAGIFPRVRKFRGSKPIETLEAFPLCHHPSHKQMRDTLVKRGQKFRDLAGRHIRDCKGSAFFLNKGKAIRVNINSRVGVDAKFFHEMQPNYSRPSLRATAVKEIDGLPNFDPVADFLERQEREKERMRGEEVDGQLLSETDLLVACPTVCCFSFMEKMFLECAVSGLSDRKKGMVSSLIQSCLGLIPTMPFDDMVNGKGQGLNILLNGSPGVGKTFTVEAASERFKKPLYSISAGELVVDHGDAHALESQLEVIFKIAEHFQAILLLDEGDAFLAKRTSLHDSHNRLVTVFLRKLEYYPGILFITSNRGIDFDDAIRSRLHMEIQFEGLSKESRRDLWSTFLSKALTFQGPADVQEDELQLLASKDLNGREIKNIVAIAHALAQAETSRVSFKYVEQAAESNERFSTEFGSQSSVMAMYT